MNRAMNYNGKEIIIREAQEADAENILAFAGELFATTDSVLSVPEEFKITPEEERIFINDHAARPDAILLVAMDGPIVIGLLNFSCHHRIKMRHTGEFGISVRSGYRQAGIGRTMLAMLLEWAAGVAQIEKILLNVFNTNGPAVRLYESLGFKEEGRQVKAVRQADGSYADMITMSYFK